MSNLVQYNQIWTLLQLVLRPLVLYYMQLRVFKLYLVSPLGYLTLVCVSQLCKRQVIDCNFYFILRSWNIFDVWLELGF